MGPRGREQAQRVSLASSSFNKSLSRAAPGTGRRGGASSGPASLASGGPARPLPTATSSPPPGFKVEDRIPGGPRWYLMGREREGSSLEQRRPAAPWPRAQPGPSCSWLGLPGPGPGWTLPTHPDEQEWPPSSFSFWLLPLHTSRRTHPVTKGTPNFRPCPRSVLRGLGSCDDGRKEQKVPRSVPRISRIPRSSSFRQPDPLVGCLVETSGPRPRLPSKSRTRFYKSPNQGTLTHFREGVLTPAACWSRMGSINNR